MNEINMTVVIAMIPKLAQICKYRLEIYFIFLKFILRHLMI